MIDYNVNVNNSYPYIRHKPFDLQYNTILHCLTGSPKKQFQLCLLGSSTKENLRK